MSTLSIARKKAGITQQQLAGLVGLTQAAIGHYERGRRTPGLAESRAIVAALNALGATCTLDDVFPPEQEATAQAA